MEQQENKPMQTVKRIGGYLYKIVPIVDSTGKVITQTLTPLMVELKARDIMQIIVGASLLAIPIAFTEETWVLGERLPFKNVLALGLISVFFISLFIYYNFYRYNFKSHIAEYVKRVLATYGFSLLVVGVILTLIQKCPWGTDNILAIKRMMIVAFPASMSAAISDVIK